MGAIIQNGNIGAIIKNGIVYGGAIKEGVGNISEVLRVPESWLFSDGYTYKIETTSTSGSLAKIQVTEYFNDVQTESVEIKHNDSSTFTHFNDIYVSYNSSSLSWNVSANTGKSFSCNETIYKEGDSPLAWSYTTTVDYSAAGISETKRELDSNKLYLITNENRELIKYYYFGNNRITRYKTAEQLEDYEFWYEDLVFPIGMNNGSSALNYYGKYWISSKFSLTSNENLGRNWQMEFNVEPLNGTSGDNVIFGSDSSYGSGAFEIYTHSNTNLKLLNPMGDDSEIGDINKKDVIISYINGVITVTADGVQLYSNNWSPNVDNTIMYIANYRNNYCFSGTMNYVGFKWLDSPTPSGADGLTYNLSVDNNHYLNIIEYDNGVQSQTTSLNDESLDYGNTPVTFGDLIISYGTNDRFSIKPNYNDNKAIKYNDTVYSGNNEILSLPDYAESDTYTLTGWIE